MRHYIGRPGRAADARAHRALLADDQLVQAVTCPGVWAPLTATWGVENRTCAIRVIGAGSPYATRVEFRQTAADINLYTAIAACLGAGLWGVENRIEPPLPVDGDAGEGNAASADRKPLPRTLVEATRLLAASEPAFGALLGQGFVDHYVRTRAWEIRQYERAVTDWELKRYFEAV